MNDLRVGPRSTGASGLSMMSPRWNCDLIQKKCSSKLPRKNLLRGETGLTGPDKRPSCPQLSGVTPPINKLHFSFFFFVIGGKNIKPSDFPEQVTGQREAAPAPQLQKVLVQFRRHFYSVLFKVEKKTADSVICVSTVRLFIQKCCCLLFCIVCLSETWK